MRQIVIAVLTAMFWLGSSQVRADVSSSDAATAQSSAKKTPTQTTGAPAWTVMPTNTPQTPAPKSSGGQDVVFIASGLGSTWIKSVATTPTTTTPTTTTTENPAVESPASTPSTTGTSAVGGFTSPTFTPVTSTPLKFTGPKIVSPKAMKDNFAPVKFTGAKFTAPKIVSPKAMKDNFAPVKFGSPKFTPVSFSTSTSTR